MGAVCWEVAADGSGLQEAGEPARPQCPGMTSRWQPSTSFVGVRRGRVLCGLLLLWVFLAFLFGVLVVAFCVCLLPFHSVPTSFLSTSFRILSYFLLS